MPADTSDNIHSQTSKEPASSDERRRPHQRAKTAVLLAHDLVEDILRRDLQPGAKLPSEREMGEQYRVARGTLREMLRYLELQGVLAIRQGANGGPVVSAPDGSHLASTLGLILALSRTPFADVIDFRMTIEPTIAARAAERAGSSAIAELQRSLDRLGDDTTGDAEFVRLNRLLHDQIARATNNPVFEFFTLSLGATIDAALAGVQYSAERRAAGRASHVKIVAAITRHNPRAAEVAMREHIQATITYLTINYPEVMKRSITWAHPAG